MRLARSASNIEHEANEKVAAARNAYAKTDANTLAKLTRAESEAIRLKLLPTAT